MVGFRCCLPNSTPPPFPAPGPLLRPLVTNLHYFCPLTFPKTLLFSARSLFCLWDLPEIPVFFGWVWGWRRGTFPEGGGNPGWWSGSMVGPSRKGAVFREGGLFRRGTFLKSQSFSAGPGGRGWGPSRKEGVIRDGGRVRWWDLPGILRVSGKVIPDNGAETAIPGLPGRGLL